MTTTRQIRVEDFYETVLTEEISTLGDIDFTVTKAPVNTKGFIILNPTSSSGREKIPYYNVVGNRIYVYGVNRKDPKTHAVTDIVQINDTANIFNYLSENLSTTFYIEKTGALEVLVWGGPVLRENIELEVLDTPLVLDNNRTNYICYDYSGNDITVEDSEEGIVVAEIVTASGIITSILYRNYKFSINGIKSPYDVAVDNGFSGTEEEWLETLIGPAGAIAEAPEGLEQTIEDNSIVITGDVVTTDGLTWIRVTHTDGSLTEYQLDEILTANANLEVVNQQIITGVFGDNGITYDSGMYVDKITGDVSFTGNPAYRNQANTFTGLNVFNGNVVFGGQVAFNYHTTTENVIFNTNLGTKQGMNFSSGGGKAIDFTNLIAGNTLTLAVVVTVSGITLTKGTATGVGVDGNQQSFSYYNIGGETYPLTLGVGVHLFAIEVFSTGIHLAYIGESTVIT